MHIKFKIKSSIVRAKKTNVPLFRLKIEAEPEPR